MFSARSMSVVDADRWADAAPVTWPRLMILAVWVAGWVAALEAPSNCTPEDPCGPEAWFAFALVLLIGSVALLWWRPVLSCVCGATFGALDVLYDNIAPVRVVFGVFAVLCVAYGSHVVASRRRQVGICAGAVDGFALSVVEDRAAGSPPLDLTDVVPPSGPVPRVSKPAVLTAVGLAVGAVLAVLAYAHYTRIEQQHLNRAISVSARVVSVTDYRTVVKVDEPEDLAGNSYHLVLLTSHPVGSTLPVLLDPLDPQWAEVVAEPTDLTPWLSLAGCAAGLAALLVLGQVEASRARRRLSHGRQPAAAFGWRAGADQLRYLSVPGGQRAVAKLKTAEHLRADSIGTGALFGDLRHGGWCAMRTETGIALPVSRLQTLRRSPSQEHRAGHEVVEEPEDTPSIPPPPNVLVEEPEDTPSIPRPPDV